MSGLVELLAGWLPRQRWYAGKGRPVDRVFEESRTVIGANDTATVLDVVLGVDHGGDLVRYQTPLTLRRQPTDAVAHALLGETDEGFVHDGLSDPEGSAAWLDALLDGRSGPLSFVHQAGELAAGLPARLAGVEQSNTSVVYGEDAILKVFRRLAPGLNPDLEVSTALARVDCPYVPRTFGYVSGEVAGQTTTLAVLQEFLPHATEGWKLATTSVRDLFAEGDLRADEVGGDFAGESERLGRTTASVHQALYDALPHAVIGQEESRETAARMHERLDAAVAEVEALAPYAESLHAAYNAVATWPHPVPVQRVHGDLHLGQVLRTETGWHLIDFEGEPARPLAERTRLMTTLRDVAGMLRSFDYAARSLLTDYPDNASLSYRAQEWSDRNSRAFCDGYAAVAGADPRDTPALLVGMELDKAVYEVLYEARHRPSWLPIPLAAVQRLAQREQVGI